MSSNPQPQQPPQPIVHPFPRPGAQVELAYREIHLAIHGDEEQKKKLGNPLLLPRPWDPATCLNPMLRIQLWQWFEDVVIWLNREYTWDVGGMIPTCWPRHPHLVHDIAVVADQRRRAGLAMTSDALEEWHRYCLPAFIDRMRTRLKSHCDDDHDSWPGRSRHQQHTSDGYIAGRAKSYRSDVEALPGRRRREESPSRQLGLVDLETGEVKQGPWPEDES